MLYRIRKTNQPYMKDYYHNHFESIWTVEDVILKPDLVSRQTKTSKVHNYRQFKPAIVFNDNFNFNYFKVDIRTL